MRRNIQYRLFMQRKYEGEKLPPTKGLLKKHYVDSSNFQNTSLRNLDGIFKETIMLHKQQILLHRKLLLNWFRVIVPVVAVHVQRFNQLVVAQKPVKTWT